MRQFAQLYQALDATTSSLAKTTLMATYFARTDAADAAWAVYFLAGGKLKRLVPTQALRAYAQEQTQMPDWLFEASYQSVGDLAETITLILPPSECTRKEQLHEWIENVLLPLKTQPLEDRLTQLQQALDGWDTETRFVCLKLVTGGFRVGVSRLLVTRALAQATGLPIPLIAQRLVGYLAGHETPDAQRYLALIDACVQSSFSTGQPYPFFLAQSVDGDAQSLQNGLGDIGQWQFEHKYDGIRAQLVKRGGQAWLWSRGEELIGEQFPEIIEASQVLPDGLVLDGEVLVWHDDAGVPASFAELQKRLGRKQISTRLLTQHPAVLMVYDLLEVDGQDCRDWTMASRRMRLEHELTLAQSARLRVSPLLCAASWHEVETLRQSARQRRTEGLMIKARESRYGIGRTRSSGLWFKYKLEPFCIDAVLVYAQKGHGRRANLYTDYTFAVWHQPDSGSPATLVPVAKAYSGLTDEEFRRVDAIIKKSTLASFGPVRRVEPTLVFEIGFEGIASSSRHKSGVALRFPRMLRWRTDKPVEEADTLDQLKALL